MGDTRYKFIGPTISFSLIGIIISAFPAIILLGSESGLEKLGLDCIEAMSVIWHFAVCICVLLPVFFFFYLRRSERWFSDLGIKRRVIFFNSALYVCIPAALEPYFSTAHTLCYVSDGQNGLELVFSAWLSLPILLLISVAFELFFRKRQFLSKSLGLS